MGVMIKRLAALFASGAVLAALLVAMTPLSAHAVENEAYVEGEVIVEFDGYASNGEKRAALVSAGATSVEYVDCYTDETEPPSVFSELVIARFDGVPMDQAVAALERASCVKRAMPNSFYGYEVGGRFVDFVEGWFTGYRELSVSFASDATSEDKRALYDDLSAVSVSESQGDCTIVLPDHLSVAYAMKRADAHSSVVFAGPVYPLYSGSHFPPSDMMESSKYDTAAEQALKAYPAGAEDVVLVSGSVWPDGLVASGLAGALDAPVLLVEHGHVPQRTLDAMKALGSARAIIVGGDAVVSPAVEDTIRSAVGSDPVRLAGIHATDTAGAVFDWVSRTDCGTAVYCSQLPTVRSMIRFRSPPWPHLKAHRSCFAMDRVRCLPLTGPACPHRVLPSWFSQAVMPWCPKRPSAPLRISSVLPGLSVLQETRCIKPRSLLLIGAYRMDI